MPLANPWKSIQQKITILQFLRIANVGISNTNFTLVVLVWRFINSHGTAQPATNPPTHLDLPQSVTPSYALFFVAHSCHCNSRAWKIPETYFHYRYIFCRLDHFCVSIYLWTRRASAPRTLPSFASTTRRVSPTPSRCLGSNFTVHLSGISRDSFFHSVPLFCTQTEAKVSSEK